MGKETEGGNVDEICRKKKFQPFHFYFFHNWHIHFSPITKQTKENRKITILKNCFPSNLDTATVDESNYYMLHFILILILVLFDHCSRGAEKYFRQGSRLNWPEGAESRESSRAVQKLEHLEVWIIQASCKCTFGIISHL